MERLQSLLLWLLRHGKHVRSLKMCRPGDSREAEHLLGGCLSICAASGQLESLTVSTCGDAPLLLGAWALAMPRLRRLDFASYNMDLALVTSLHQMTALRKLRLFGREGIDVSPGVRLPAGLEQLEISGWAAELLTPEKARRGRRSVLWLGTAGWAC